MLVLALAACGEDPSLRVQVDFERPPIDRIVVSVYESPSITCEQIEYADLDEAQLAALLVAEQSLETDGTTEGALEGLSRTDHKLIVARGYSQTGELLEAGCEPHDLVVENDKALVKAHVIGSVAAQVVTDMDPLNPQPLDPLKIGVLVTDRDGLPLVDRPVSWRMIGPAGSEATQATNILETGDGAWQPDEPECTGDKGTVQVLPVTPNLVGGFAVSMRAAWTTSAQTVFSGITNTDFALADLAIPDETTHPCAVSVKRVGGATQKRLVCVDGAFAREFPVTLANGVAKLGAPASTPLTGDVPIALFALPNQLDATLSDVYALDKDGKVTGLFGATGELPTANCADCADHVVDAMVAPACGERDTAKMLMVVRTQARPDKLVVMPARGGLAVDIQVSQEVSLEIALNNAGCVTAIGPSGYEPRQLSVLDLITPTGSFTRGVYACSPTCKRVVLPVAEAAVGFTKTSPPYLIGAASDATGVVLATWGLVPDPEDATTDRLVERAARVPAGGPPGHLAIGTFDEDDGSDMIWDIAFRARGGTNFELAYASAGGVRLQALSALVGLSAIDLFSTDVTQDDHDDIIIVGRKAITNQGGVLVVPTHAIAPPKAIPVHTCGH